jgi:glycosyltransferase involved in cell wall biosynthesis
MRVALVHYWLLNMRGGEAVLEAIGRLFPKADIFTLFYDPEAISPEIRSHKIYASWLNPARRHYRTLLPLMPLALEQFDLRGYDLVISSESGPAKGVLTSSTARHVCYCHTPMRYLWELYPAYREEWAGSSLKRLLIAPLANYLRIWDFASAARVDEFIANSRNVQRRIWKTYRRHSRVIYPPVPVETFYWKEPEGYYLIVSELVAYKRIDQAVQLFSSSGRQLKIVGDGPEYGRLKRMASRAVEFCGRVNGNDLRDLYARCNALLIPGEEDFGLTAVEAQASGKPVIALGRGGVLETVSTDQPVGGVFYPEPDAESLDAAIRRFEAIAPQIRSQELQQSAARFSERVFQERMRHVLGCGASS